MDRRHVYTICGMCTSRCPARAEVVNGRCVQLFGNPYAEGIQGALCARGAASIALLRDEERPQYPMLRVGKRGEGKWKRVSWDEALDHVAAKLGEIKDKYGPEAVLLSDRGGPFRDFHRAFLRGFGSPNYCNHDASCARNVQHAALSLFGFGRKGVTYDDLGNCRHVVLQTRNMFEALNIKEVNDTLDGMKKGGKLSVIDIRANVSASKADNFFMIRPGTDYAFNLAVIHVLLADGLYDKSFAEQWISGLNELRTFVQPYTPQWAEQETGVSADKITRFAWQLSQAAPAVLWHPGWMNARYNDSFYVSRTIYIVNALLGAIGAPGGLPIINKPADVDRKGLNALMDLYPKPDVKRADGVGWKYKHFEEGPGLLHLAFKAMETEEPYPIKGYIAYRHDPLMAFPDPKALKKVWDKLDLLVSVTFTWSDTAWYSDVVLPLSPFLERDDVLGCKAGLKPYFFIRKRAQQPMFETRAEWEIFAGLARRLGLKELDYENIEDIWKFQLEGTGVEIEDFEKTGMVPLTDKPLYRSRDELKFKTPSGKIEIVSSLLEENGIESLKPYQSPQKPEEGRFRLTFGRAAVHTQGHTLNNPLLFEQMSENVLWINTESAKELGIEDGEYVRVEGTCGTGGRIKAFVTEFIHPEAIFMLHGFGHELPVESRAKGKGVADNTMMCQGLEVWDRAGGAVSCQEHFVAVRKDES